MARPLLDNSPAVATLRRRIYTGSIALAALTLCIALILSYSTANAKNRTQARAAHVLSGNENAVLHLVHADGSTLHEEGRASGSLPGPVRARLHLGAHFAGSFVFYAHSGTIIGGGSAKSHQGHYPYVSFSGIANITGGTRRYLHVHGSLGFYGVLNRNDSAVQMQTRGSLTY